MVEITLSATGAAEKSFRAVSDKNIAFRRRKAILKKQTRIGTDTGFDHEFDDHARKCFG